MLLWNTLQMQSQYCVLKADKNNKILHRNKDRKVLNSVFPCIVWNIAKAERTPAYQLVIQVCPWSSFLKGRCILAGCLFSSWNQCEGLEVQNCIISSLLHSTLIFQHDFHWCPEPLQWTNQWAHVCKSHVISRRQHVTWLFPTPQLPLPPILFSGTSLRRVGRGLMKMLHPCLSAHTLYSWHVDWLWVCAPTISVCVC